MINADTLEQSPRRATRRVTHRLAVVAALSCFTLLNGNSFAEPSLKKFQATQNKHSTTQASPEPIMKFMEAEMLYTMEHLAAYDGTKPYYLGYTTYEEESAIVAASLGAVIRNSQTKARNLNIDLRVGGYELDNTHQLRDSGRGQAVGSGNIRLSLDDDEDAIRHTLWLNTDRVFNRAAKRLARVKSNLKVKVEEEDQSHDFSVEDAQVHYTKPRKLVLDREQWASKLRAITALARRYPLIYDSSVTLGAISANRYMVTSEGTRLQTNHRRFRITITAGTKADDGMNLSQNHTFNAASPEKLPNDREITEAFEKVIAQVLALRRAPLAEPYIGPAILRNRASAVFFHEIFGHRIEGHRQKDVTEGQTFTKKIGKAVLPTFLSVYDDPTLSVFGDVDLRGYYRFDDEGVPAQRATLIDKGILRSFLLSRRPLEGFARSNGHGRRQAGRAAVSRQANLLVESTKQVSFSRIRELLIEECKKQGKPYGLLFEDISGGFTTTSRRGPQSFKVLPIVAYKVYADGRPDELIRGADIVGTPLTSFEKILYTGDDPAVFNGSCGAESGWMPVSAISPSILVSTIEIEKRTRSQSKPPILDPPLDKQALSN